MSGLRSSFTRKMVGNRDAQSHDQKDQNQIKNNCKQNSPRIDVSWRHTHCFGQAMDWWLLVEGELKLYHSVWEPPIMYVVWKILATLGCYVDNEIIPLKLCISISKSSSGTSTNPCFPLRRAYLFTFTLCHHPLIKNTSWRAPLSLHVLLLVYIEYDLTGSLLPWITISSQPLIFKGALHLCFAVSERASEIPFCYVMLWLFWESVVVGVKTGGSRIGGPELCV